MSETPKYKDEVKEFLMKRKAALDKAKRKKKFSSNLGDAIRQQQRDGLE